MHNCIQEVMTLITILVLIGGGIALLLVAIHTIMEGPIRKRRRTYYTLRANRHNGPNGGRDYMKFCKEHNLNPDWR